MAREDGLRLRAAALSLTMAAAAPAIAAAQVNPAQKLSAPSPTVPPLRPSLPAQPLAAKDTVTVSVRGGAAITFVSRVSRASDFRAGQAGEYATLVSAHAKANDVPEHLVHRIIMRESKYQPNLIGRGGALGMMQIKLATARGMGYGGTADGLLDPQTNLTWGVRYLAGAWRAAEGDPDLAVRKYAAGYYVRRARAGAANQKFLQKPQQIVSGTSER